MPRDRPVTEVMTRDVLTLTADQTVESAVSLLTGRNISGAPVVDADGRLVGLLDDSDLIVSDARLHGPTMIELLGAYFPLPGEQRRFEAELRHALGRTVGEAMNEKPPSVHVGDVLEDVATLMIDRHVSRVPVVDDDRRVVGIVTRGDLVQAMGRP